MNDDTKPEGVELVSGQRVELREGVVRVTKPAPRETNHHYKMCCSHEKDYEKAVTTVRAQNYQQLVDFLKQLENLDYRMLTIERIEGVQSSLQK